MFEGRHPWIWLNPVLKIFSEDTLKIKGGIIPDNLFSPTEKNTSLVNWPKELGILPPKLLEVAEITFGDDKFPKEVRIRPIK